MSRLEFVEFVGLVEFVEFVATETLRDYWRLVEITGDW